MWFIVLLIFDLIFAKAIHYETILGYECKTNEHCSDFVPNSICFNHICVCQLGYQSNGDFRCVYKARARRQANFGIQIQMLGEPCESNDECRRTPVDGTKVCTQKRCECSSGHVPIDSYRCIRDFAPVSENAQITQSSPIEELPGYGSMCLKNQDCQHTTVLLECFHHTCVCLEGYVPLGKYLCYNIHGQDAPFIESSSSTSTLSTTTLSLHSPDDEMAKFLGKIGNTCTNDYYCRRSVTRSHCYNGICSCMDGYMSLDAYTCTESTNIDSKTSVASYKSLLGGKCTTNRHCQTSNAICLNNICHCPRGSFPIDSWNCLEDPDASNEETSRTITTIETTIKTTKTTTTTTTTTKTTTTTTTTAAAAATTATTAISATSFLWWPWSPSTTTRQSLINWKNMFSYRCLLNRQCNIMDRNSHCTSFGRCTCNVGYTLKKTNKGQQCIRKIFEDNDCD
ncbi:unnamed protein product [Rotaria socialis]|uniref:EGF-like domain-containing protein n=1 Tax=Rotaria socialis TaxID=392032 RepID=A0A817T5H2_9BILA|nr:unnamed protein product [Rotaria socialis]CAF4471715.1 unnamed protein product [Rotaria socialis]